ncbi:helix-turn-helix transcriptional regulator [Achromobacter insuavis]|uniref:LuxR family transcriptional regulator n=1 Tax=Achromobacter insuavis AXX-A TaxID=1003200 RepID=F7T0T3_9BURK|nr:helix-turn-helix transcriptional regulator [Achromobacter insuavis]EGP46012.1 LuxR family transcriptional regulator [Achromobacter insuavis AXX-A]
MDSTTGSNRGSILDAVIHDIYMAGLGEHGWDVPLHRIRHLAGGRLAVLMALDQTSLRPSVNVAAGDDDAWTAAFQQAYGREFFALDPVVPVVSAWRAGRWFEDTKAFSQRQRQSHPYYQEFLRPYGLGGLSGLFLHRGAFDSAYLSLSGAADSRGLSDGQRHAIDTLYPHVSRALRLRARVGHLETRLAIAESVLDGIGTPLLILDECRRLVMANRAAETLMAAEPALRIVDGRLAVRHCASDAEWRAACLAGGLLLRKRGGAPLPLALTPVPEGSRLAGLAPGRLTLISGAELAAPAARARRLRLFHGLTQAEAELALLLCRDGLSPRECAEARGVTLGTVRFQLKAIYAKTGVTRAAQLSALVLRA